METITLSNSTIIQPFPPTIWAKQLFEVYIVLNNKYKTKLNFLGKVSNDAESSLDCQDNGSEEASSRTARQRLTCTGQFTTFFFPYIKVTRCLSGCLC